MRFFEKPIKEYAEKLEAAVIRNPEIYGRHKSTISEEMKDADADQLRERLIEVEALLRSLLFFSTRSAASLSVDFSNLPNILNDIMRGVSEAQEKIQKEIEALAEKIDELNRARKEMMKLNRLKFPTTRH